MKLLFSIIYVSIIGILSHYVGEALPRRLFNEKKFPFCIYRWEKDGKIYDLIGIKKWKTKVPDMSRFMRDMLPKRITRKATSENINTLVKETCVAEFIHICLSVLSVGIYFFWKNHIGKFLICVFVVCNTPFILIQRYNRPHLISLRERLKEREEKKIAIPNSLM